MVLEVGIDHSTALRLREAAGIAIDLRTVFRRRFCQIVWDSSFVGDNRDLAMRDGCWRYLSWKIDEG